MRVVDEFTKRISAQVVDPVRHQPDRLQDGRRQLRNKDYRSTPPKYTHLTVQTKRIQLCLKHTPHLLKYSTDRTGSTRPQILSTVTSMAQLNLTKELRKKGGTKRTTVPRRASPRHPPWVFPRAPMLPRQCLKLRTARVGWIQVVTGSSNWCITLGASRHLHGPSTLRTNSAHVPASQTPRAMPFTHLSDHKRVPIRTVVIVSRMR